jgi:acyl-ACP thioesterase
MNPLPQLEAYTIRTYDIDCHKQLSIPALVRLMQETAMQQVLELKISVWDLEAFHLAWVLIRKRIEIKRLPSLGEKISIHSLPTGADRVFTFRDFRVYDEAGHLLASASSTWLLMHTQTRQMARIPAELLVRFSGYFPAPEDCLPQALDQLPAMKKPLTACTYEVGWYDLDFINHLNNVHFAKWMIEALPEETLGLQQLRRMDLLFLTEGNLGDSIDSAYERVDEFTYLHQLVRCGDKKVLASGRTIWG